MARGKHRRKPKPKPARLASARRIKATPAATTENRESDDDSFDFEDFMSLLPEDLSDPLLDPFIKASEASANFVTLLKAKFLDALCRPARTASNDIGEGTVKATGVNEDAGGDGTVKDTDDDKKADEDEMKHGSRLQRKAPPLPKKASKARKTQSQHTRSQTTSARTVPAPLPPPTPPSDTLKQSPDDFANWLKDTGFAFLDCMIDYSFINARFLSFLPSPKTLPGGCPNTWLMEITLFPKSNADETISRVKSSSASHNAGNFAEPACTCCQTPAQPLMPETCSPFSHDDTTEGLVPFQLEITFTLWNELFDIPVCYKGVDENGSNGLVPIAYGAIVDFRMPASFVTSGGAPSHAHHMIFEKKEDSPSFPVSAKHQCSASCRAFSNELLLGLNLGIHHIWSDGGTCHPFIQPFRSASDSTISDKNEEKNKGKAKSTPEQYSDPKLQDLLPFGTFQPAKILLYSNAMVKLLKMELKVYYLSMAFHAREEIGRIRSEPNLDDSTELPAPSPSKAPKKRNSTGARSSRTDLPLNDRNAAGPSKLGQKAFKAEPVNVDETETAGQAADTYLEATLATSAVVKGFYSRTSVNGVPTQHLLICEGCGTFGVDRIGALPWSKLRRCSGCRVVWYCSTQCQKADWATSHREKCIPREGTSGSAEVLDT